ncbi:MAG: hypothetical protein V1793_12770 [Pseudomonadota bacterium]
MPALLTGINNLTPYQVQTFLNTDTQSPSVQTRETDKNAQSSDSPALKLSISAEAQTLQQKYARKRDDLEQKHAVEKQHLESDYEQEKRKLEQEYRQKNSSLTLSIYA